MLSGGQTWAKWKPVQLYYLCKNKCVCVCVRPRKIDCLLFFNSSSHHQEIKDVIFRNIIYSFIRVQKQAQIYWFCFSKVVPIIFKDNTLSATQLYICQSLCSLSISQSGMIRSLEHMENGTVFARRWWIGRKGEKKKRH